MEKWTDMPDVFLMLMARQFLIMIHRGDKPYSRLLVPSKIAMTNAFVGPHEGATRLIQGSLDAGNILAELPRLIVHDAAVFIWARAERHFVDLAGCVDWRQLSLKRRR